GPVSPGQSGRVVTATSLVVPGGTITVTIVGGPAYTTDWVGLTPVNGADNASVDWKYLSGSTAPPLVGLATATVTFFAPTTAGVYNVRFFSSNGWTKLATSNNVTVGATATVASTSVVAGGSISVTIAGGP